MTDDSGCDYCDSSFRTEEGLVEHLESHDREELSRVDRKRVETHASGESDSRLGRVTPDGGLSRRATLVAAGTVLAGIGVGLGRRMASSHTQIQDWNDLDNIRSSNNNLGDSYVLANDLDQNTAGYSSVASPTANSGDGFDPIGDGISPFTGTFDGQGNEIRGLSIDRGSEQNVGLFGRIDGGTVQDLSITGATVTGEGIGPPPGPGVGVLAGGMDSGNITDCLVSGDVETTTDLGGGLIGSVEGGTITRAAVNVTVTGMNGGTGGFAGTVAVGSSISDSYVIGDVNGGANSFLVGGFIGYLYGGGGGGEEMQSSGGGQGEWWNDDTPDTPDTPGQDVTASNTSVTTSYSAGSVTGGNDVGGFIGDGDGDGTEVTDCYWDTQSSGQTDSYGGTPLTTSEMQGSAAAANMTGFDFTTNWQTVDGSDDRVATDGYPVLTALDRNSQLTLQGVLAELSGVIVSGNNLTFSNNTIEDDG